MNIGEEVRARRNAKGMAIWEVSERANVSQSAISNFERGGDIKLSNFQAICKALNVSIKLVDAD